MSTQTAISARPCPMCSGPLASNGQCDPCKEISGGMPKPAGPRDTLGVTIEVGDTVRVTSWGAPVRLIDTGRTAVVAGFTASSNVILDNDGDTDPIARGRAVRPGYLCVARRDGQVGHEGNRKDI